MGIEPTSSAWKAEVLPLNYARRHIFEKNNFLAIVYIVTTSWWRGEDSNLRRQCRQIYSLIPLATREPLQNRIPILLPVYNKLSISIKFNNEQRDSLIPY